MEKGRTPLTQGTFTAADFDAARAAPVMLARAGVQPVEGAPVRVAGPQGARRRSCAAPTPRPAPDRGRRPVGDDHARHAPPGHRREVGQGGDGRPQLEEPAGHGQGARPPLPALDGQPAQPRPPQRRARRDGLRDGRPRRVRRLGGPERPEGDEEVPAPVRRPRRRLAPAGFGVQARRLLHGHRQQEHHGGVDVHGRRHQLRRRLHADRRGQPRARACPDARRPQLLAEHPGREGRHRHRQRRDPGAGRGDGDPVPECARRRGRGVPPGGRGRAPAGPGPRVRHHRRPGPARGADHDPHGHRQHRHRRDRGEPAPEAGRRARPGRGLHHHRHPRGQHEPAEEPVLGPVRDQRRRRAPPGHPQDRHQQRGARPQRLRLHRRPRRPRPQGRRVRAGRRRVERQLGQLAGQRPRGTAVLDRRHHVRVAGLHGGGHQGLEDQRLQGAQQPRPRVRRPVDGARVVEPQRGRRAVPAGHRAQGRPSPGGALRRGGPGQRRVRGRARVVDGRQPGLAGSGRRGPGRIGGPENTATAYFYNPVFNPYGRSWGPLLDDAGCKPAESPSPSIDPCASIVGLSTRRPNRWSARRRRSRPRRPRPRPSRPRRRPPSRRRPSRPRSRRPSPPQPSRRPPSPPRPSRGGRNGRSASRNGRSQHLLRNPAYDPPGRERFEGPDARASSTCHRP